MRKKSVVKGKKIPILKTVLLLVVITLLLMNLVSTLVYYGRTVANLNRIEERDMREAGDYGVSLVTNYASYPWLLQYWRTHAEEMDVPRGVFSDEKAAWWEDHIWLRLINVQELDEAALKNYSEEQQRQIAEYCYIMVAEEFDFLVENQDFTTYECLALPTSGEPPVATVLIRGLTDEDTGEYLLGERQPLQEKQVAELMELYAEGENSKHRVINIMDQSGITDLAYPKQIMEKDGIGYVLIVSRELEPLLKLLRENVLNVEGMQIVVAVIGGVSILLLIILGIGRPIHRIQETVHRYAASKNIADVTRGLSGMTKKRRKTEMDSLASDILDMAVDIDCYVEEIQESANEQERRNAELATAAAIQTGLLPTAFPEHEVFSLFAVSKPAKEVGGDFYDFFFLDDDHLALVIADVSDKGIPAALFMMTSRTLIRSTLRRGVPLTEAAAHVNGQLAEYNPEGMFVTAWIAVLTLSTGELLYVNAGHEKPAFGRSGQAYTLERTPHDLPLASMPKLKFTGRQVTLSPGDRIFIYTDGVPEAADARMESFGSDRMLGILNAGAYSEPSGEIRAMQRAIAKFEKGAEQFDDITMLCLHYHGKTGNIPQ